jgi:hypothetical protein
LPECGALHDSNQPTPDGRTGGFAPKNANSSRRAVVVVRMIVNGRYYHQLSPELSRGIERNRPKRPLLSRTITVLSSTLYHRESL